MKSIQVSNLSVSLSDATDDIVTGVSFAIEAGSVLGIVGESGSGKSTVAMALLGFARRGARIREGEVLIDGTDVLQQSGDSLRKARGNLVAYVPQDPSVSLNPVMRVKAQLEEMLPGAGQREAEDRIDAVLNEVELPATKEFLRKYPHEMSGGQQQRVAIAMAVLAQPRLLVLDEPTTALDVSTQARVLEMVARLCKDHDMAAVYVSHDLGVVSSVADHILVLYAGRVVEFGSRERIFEQPSHPYTVGLLASMPTTVERRQLIGIPGRAPSPGHRPHGCTFAPRCSFSDQSCTSEEPALVLAAAGHDVRCIRPRQVRAAATSAQRPSLPINAEEGAEALLEVVNLQASYGSRTVLTDISLSVAAGTCVALVGESGSGKSTLARSLVGLHDEWEGKVRLRGEHIARAAAKRPLTTRRRLQYVFQNPYSSLNPRRTIVDSIAVPLDLFLSQKGPQARRAALEAMEKVGLSTTLADRYPSDLSGGERQRAAIARAIVCRPDVLLCDEITSALDVSVQATVIELLRDLMSEGLTLVFVTHDLAVVRSLADRIAVLDQGRIIEEATSNQVFEIPQAAYTRRLLAATPVPPTSAGAAAAAVRPVSTAIDTSA